MPLQLFSRIRTVRFRKKKPKSPKPPTKPLRRRVKSKIRKACKSMADRFRPRRQNPVPGNTNSNNNVVITTPIRKNVAPSRTSLSSQKSGPVRPTGPIHAAVRTQGSGGVSKAPHPPPNTSVLPTKMKIPSAGATSTRKQSSTSSPVANYQKNTGVSQTARSNAVRSSSPRLSRRDSLAMKDHLNGSSTVDRRQRSKSLVTATGNSMSSSSPQPSGRGPTDSLAVKNRSNGSPTVVRRERSNSLVATPVSLLSTSKREPQVGKIPRKRSASISGSRMSGTQPQLLLPKRASPPPYTFPTVCTQQGRNLKDLTGQKMAEPKEMKTDVLSSVKSIPRSPSRERRRKEKEEKQKMSGTVTTVKPVAPSSTTWPSSLSQSQRSAKRDSTASLAASGSVKTSDLRRNSDTSSCGSGRPSPALPRKGSSGVQDSTNWGTGNSGSAVKATAVATKTTPTGTSSTAVAAKTTPTWMSSPAVATKTTPTGTSSTAVAAKTTPTWMSSPAVAAKTAPTGTSSPAVAAKTTRTGTSSPALDWKQDLAQNSHSRRETTVKVYPVSSGRQNTGGGSPQSASLIATTAAWITNRLQQALLPYYTMAGTSSYSSKASSSSSSLTVWGAKGGVVGITNMGNTCYLNCMLQCLGHTPEMTELFLRRGRTRTLTGDYSDLMKQMWFPSTSLSSNPLYPRDLKFSIASLHPEFYGSSQHDAQELLRFLLAGLQNEWLVTEGRSTRRLAWADTNKTDKLSVKERGEIAWNQSMFIEDTPLAELFMGQLLSTLYCCSCGHSSTTFDPTWDLALPFPPGTTNESVVSLIDCFKAFHTEEVLDGNNKPFCSGCHSFQRCCKRFTIHRPPSILVLHLKRFHGTRSRRKLEATVQIPYHLNINKFLTHEIARELAQKCEHACYDLYAMANHSGDDSWGHYTATYQHHTTQKWYTVSDDKVYSCPSLSNYNTVDSKAAYVLFYRRVIH